MPAWATGAPRASDAAEIRIRSEAMRMRFMLRASAQALAEASPGWGERPV
jgi:hypothetical protein